MSSKVSAVAKARSAAVGVRSASVFVVIGVDTEKADMRRPFGTLLVRAEHARRPRRVGRAWLARGTQAAAPWHFLYFLPLPHGHGSFRPTFGPSCRTVFTSAS